MSEDPAIYQVKRKGGRPKKSSDIQRSKIIGFRVKLSEYYKLKSQAETLGLRVPDFCRTLVLGKKVESVLVKQANQEAVRQLSRIGVNINQVAKHYNQGSPAEESLRELVKQLREVMRRL